MKMQLKALLVGLAFAAAGIGSAQAATITYENAADDPKVQLTIDDSGAGFYRFSLTTLVGQADFLAIGFNLAGSGNPLTNALFSLVSATRLDGGAITPTLELFGNDTGSQSDCGPGCNFNGAGSASLFDYILRIGTQGSSGDDYVRTVVFDLVYGGSLDDNPFSQLAFRAQSTSNLEGSIKADLIEVAPVPLPAGGVLLLTGLAGLAMLRRRKSH